MQILSKNVINAIFSALDTARLKEYPAIMCFEDFHISVVWVYHRTLSGNGIPAAEYTEVVTETVYLPPDPQDPDEYTAPTIKRAQSPSQRHRAAAILRLARGLTSARARSGIPRHSGNCHHLFFAQSPELFEYDLDGNMTKDGRFVYSWNGENRLVKAETRDDLPLDVPRYRIEYAYDHQGRMVSKDIFDVTRNSQLETRNFLWDNWNIIAETVPPLTPSSLLPATSFYVWGLDLSGIPQGAGGVGGLLAVIREDGTFAPCYDANGNVTEYVALTTTHYPLTTFPIVAHYEYDAFGNIVVQLGSMADGFAFRFSTKPFCAILGKVEYQRRIYDPPTGSWISRDPIEEKGGLNLYAFARNDSINHIDVLGEAAQVILVAPVIAPSVLYAAAAALLAVATLPSLSEGISQTLLSAAEAMNELADAAADVAAGAADYLKEKHQQICNSLNQIVQTAKSNASQLGKCKCTMNCYELKVRHSAWLALAVARAQRDVVCWGGGDDGHQWAHADAWVNVANCTLWIVKNRCL